MQSVKAGGYKEPKFVLLVMVVTMIILLPGQFMLTCVRVAVSATFALGMGSGGQNDHIS